ncbi:MAG: hypothetical protein H7X77_03720, partial [Anaerolineae bacterium]|nr:hypothetical protein [Anaerolineae bacterium]
LAVQVLEGFDPAQPEVVRGNYWLAINRDGSITALTDPIQNFNVLRAAPNGSILFTGNMDQGTGITTFKLDYLRPDGTMTTLWDNTGDTANHFWDIAWVTPSPVSADLTPFPPAF